MIFFLLLSLFGKSVFSSIIEDARPHIEKINEILGDASTDPAFLTLSNFLSIPKNWSEFSGTFKNGLNRIWLYNLTERFQQSVLKHLYSYNDIALPEDCDYPRPVADYRKALDELNKFNSNPYYMFDNFFQLWINTLTNLNLLHKNSKDPEILKCVYFKDLPTVDQASKGLFDAFKSQIKRDFPRAQKYDFFKELMVAVDGKVSEPKDTSVRPASESDVSLNSLLQSGGKGSKPEDTSGGPSSVPPDGWSTQKKILVFGGIGVVIVSAILIVLLVLRKPRPAIVPTA